MVASQCGHVEVAGVLLAQGAVARSQGKVTNISLHYTQGIYTQLIHLSKP